MEKAVLVSCVLILVVQIARAQNLAALFGLGGFDMAESQTPGSSSCPYQVHPDRRKFNQLVNNRMMTQECAPGTMFVLSKCSCDNIPKGGNGGGPMPGSNPRMEAGLGADRNSLMSALMSQLSGALGGAFPPPTPRAPRPSPRNNSPMNTNQLNSIRQKVTSGIRPGGSSQPSRGPKRGTNRATTSSTASRSSGNLSGGNPMAALMAGIGGGPSSSSTGGGADPFAALMAGMGGGAGSPTGGALGGNDLAALMAGLGGGSNPGSASTSLTGNTNAAPLLGGTTAPAKPKIIDMTNFFNAQGIMSGTAGLRAQNNVPINYAKLHQLDLLEVIDLGDLTPAGLLAANAHFSKPGTNIIG